MKTMKKVLAMALALAMVLTGLYIVKMDGTEVQAAAADVNTDLLSVKVQSATDGSNAMRFISSVDSLNYSKVGFEVTTSTWDEAVVHQTSTVFKRIDSVENKVAYTFSPKVVDTDSEYFVTAKMNVDANKDYLVRAFVITLDNETVYGQSRCVSIADGHTGTDLNLAFVTTDTTIKVGDTLSATYTGGTADATVIAVDGTTVHVRVDASDVAKESLPSATKFTFGEAGSVIYRNLYTKYADGADTTWYDVYKDTESKFIIATDADLYGFQSLSYANKFASKTLYIVSDIEANSGTPRTKAEWDVLDKSDLSIWYGISGNSSWAAASNGSCFSGTFDGQGHTISGIYMPGGNTDCFGFFRATQNSSRVQNFRLENSYIQGGGSTKGTGVGSIVGRTLGTFTDIYSNAVVVSNAGTQNSNGAGGMAGIVNWAAGATNVFENCWYDGELYSSTNDAGGIVGAMSASGKTLQMNNCLNTGVIAGSVEATVTGGICGRVTAGTIAVNNCLNGGVENSTVTTVSGTLIGGIVSGATASINLSYGVGDSWDEKIIGTSEGTVSGNYANETVTEASIIGYNGLSLKSGLDFQNKWTLMAEGTPAPKSVAVSGRLYMPDIEWETTDEGIYKISSAEELSGVAYVVNAGETGYTDADYILTEDIILNIGQASDWKNTAPMYEWLPIGFEGVPFKGTFSGEGKTISGLYCNSTASHCALFGVIQEATVENLYIKNSYLNSSDSYMASAIGVAIGGKISGIYSNAILNSTSTSDWARSGGIVGQVQDKEATISNCWFDGTHISKGGRIGGIMGWAGGAKVTILHCLSTGTVENSFNNASVIACVGGLIGGVASSNTTTLIVEDCMNAGTLKLNGSTYCMGIVFGWFGWNAKVTVNNTYATTNKAIIKGEETTHDLIYSAGMIDSGTKITDLTGIDITGENAKTNTALDFTTYWTTVEGSTPILTTFKNVK